MSVTDGFSGRGNVCHPSLIRGSVGISKGSDASRNRLQNVHDQLYHNACLVQLRPHTAIEPRNVLTDPTRFEGMSVGRDGQVTGWLENAPTTHSNVFVVMGRKAL